MRGALVHGQRWLRAAIGDTALVADRIGGLNGATPIDHSGAPNGCALGMPLWCQAVASRSTQPSSGAVSGIYYVVCIPIYIAAGEDDREWLIEVDLSRPFGSSQEVAEIRDLSFAVEEVVPLTIATGEWADGSVTYRGQCPELSTGWHHLCVVRNLSSDDDDSAIMGGRMTPVFGASRAVGVPSPDSSAVGNPFAAISSFVPSTVTDFSEEEIYPVTSSANADVGVNGWAMTKLVRLQNSLWEWITGARIPGNADRQVGLTRKHDQALWTSEGAIDMPVVAVAVGASSRDGAGKTIRTAVPGWSLTPSHNTGPINVSRANVWMPDFDDGTSTMTCRVVVIKENGDPTQWRFRITSAAGTSSYATLSSLDGIAYGCSITGVPYTAGALNSLTLQVDHIGGGGAATTDQIAITGWAIAHT